MSKPKKTDPLTAAMDEQPLMIAQIEKRRSRRAKPREQLEDDQ